MTKQDTGEAGNMAQAVRLKAALKPLAEPLAISFYRHPPAFVAPLGQDAAPPNEAGRTGAVPAGCVFWIKGVNRTFATTPADHANCSIGSFTHGLISLDEASRRDDTGAVLGAGWVTEGGMAALPVVRDKPASIVYGPLGEADRADVVLVRLNGLGLMTMRDALPDLRIEGKPQCHIIAIAKEEGVPAASVGCALSRSRTGMKPEEMTAALPGARLSEIIEALEETVGLNRSMARYAGEDARRFGAG